MASFTVPPPPLEDHPDGLLPARGSQTPSVSFVGPLDPSRSVINRPRAHSSVSTRSRSKSSGAALIRSLLEEGQDGDEGTTNFGRWGAVNGNLSDYEEVMTSRGSFSLLNKKTGEVLKEPPKSWGYADPAFKNSRTTAKSVFETEGFASLLSYLVERPEVVGGVDKIDEVLERWEGREAELMKMLKKEEDKAGPTGVFARLTDTKACTGASKKRFDAQSIRFAPLPIDTGIFLSEKCYVGCGHDMNPLLFCLKPSGWEYVRMLEQPSEEKKPATGPQKGSVAAARALFQNKTTKGQDTASKSDKLKTTHESLISCVCKMSTSGPCTKFSTSGTDGKLVIWSIDTMSLDMAALGLS